jgi:Uma2 family endonuclease
MMQGMSVGALPSIEEYLNTRYRPDCDFIDGEVVERNAGKRRHGYAQAEITVWFGQRKSTLRLQPITELRLRVAGTRVRIPDVLVAEIPIPDEDVFTTPPYLCIEVMSPNDTMNGMQDRIDDYLRFGVPNVWVIDPEKHRGWRVTNEGWATATDGNMRTADARVVMPLADVLLP